MTEFRPIQRGEEEFTHTLWKDGFGYNYDFTSLYNRSVCSPDTVFLAADDNIPVAFATFFPCSLISEDGSATPIRTMYGLATLKAYRGRGLAGDLLKNAFSYYSGNSTAFAIRPTKDSLFDFYVRKADAHIAFRKRVLTFHSHSACIENGISIRSADACEYSHIREVLLNGICHIRYTDEQILFQKNVGHLFGGDIFIFGNNEACGCGDFDNYGNFILREFIGDDNVIHRCVLSLMRLMCVSSITAILPVSFGSTIGGAVLYEALLVKTPTFPLADIPVDAYFGLDFH